ncbi:MAG TPA: ribulose-phosphate 3-epimerase [Gemmatimonadaceae bacterium]|nr:ribulose-phosphate 3-epimerase [Gemmatimonadaceae bacterium]
MTRVRIAPSILSADFAKLGDQLAMCEQAGADWIHIDVMDGRFVPNLTYGAKVIETCKRCTSLPLDVHLMVVEPENYFDTYAKAGANVLTLHAEAAPHLHRQIQRIKELGVQAGVAINPATSVSAIEEILSDIDLLLVMTVNPGFGAQKFIESTVAKIEHAREMLATAESHALLEVDGGIARDTIQRCREAGADTFVAGNAVFAAPDLAAAIAELRSLAGE